MINPDDIGGLWMFKKQKSKRAFDTVADLATDPGLVGLALQTVPEWMRCEADRRDDAWKLLLGAREMPKSHRSLFLAAESQRQAILRFSRKAQGTGDVKSSWYDKLLTAIKSGNKPAQRVAIKKIFGGMYRTDRGRFLLNAAKSRPEIQARIKRLIVEAYKNDVRRLGRRKANAKPKRLTIADCSKDYFSGDRIALTMTGGWMRGSKHGFPGFCFCSDAVILQLLRRMLNLHALELASVRTLRQRLGLKKASVLVQQFRCSNNEVIELCDAKGKPIWQGKL